MPLCSHRQVVVHHVIIRAVVHNRSDAVDVGVKNVSAAAGHQARKRECHVEVVSKVDGRLCIVTSLRLARAQSSSI